MDPRETPHTLSRSSPLPHALLGAIGSRPRALSFAGRCCRRKNSQSRAACSTRFPARRRPRLTSLCCHKRSRGRGTSSTAAAGAAAFRSSPPPARSTSPPSDTTTASATHLRTRPSPRLRRRPTGGAPPPTPETAVVFLCFGLSGVRHELLSGV
ncbi:serine/arginine repetitive matrix protein 1-like [Triticum aestivum]|uniref:serine/arginine repetitive matrix protein 1-like n=1 Tax=Triticum aestivum TaxID=4565 RepID=UPI001D020EA9|nr:serine/arginine repetitive matrix protein 1-like [Triticum aestivum]